MTFPLVIAHRGASHDAPENTLAAFRLAWEQEADAIETDLRLTRDGAIVAFHDEDGRRVLGDSRPIRDLDFAELRSLDAGAWKHSRWSGERVPLLSEILASAPGAKQIVLELKEDLVSELSRELPREIRNRTTLIAFDGEIIARAKQAMPECRALWLFGDYARISPRRRGEFLATRVRDLGVDGVDLRHDLRLNGKILDFLHAGGRTVFTYTVNHPLSVRRAARLGLDGLTTDRPGDTRRWLGIST
jgi:glycerophosphoryl diester phosphodiesterase